MNPINNTQSGMNKRFSLVYGRRNGQSTIELACLIAIVAAALLGMQIYMKRAVSGGLRRAVDSIGDQYGPRQVTADIVLETSSKRRIESTLLRDQPAKDETGKDIKIDVIKTESFIDEEISRRTGSEHIGALGSSLWN